MNTANISGIFAATRFANTIVVAAAALMILAFLSSVPARADDDRDDHAVHIMTQNMDQGSTLAAIVTAPPQDFLAAVQTTIQNILASKPAERAAAMAREIAKERPDIVGLQEAAILRTGSSPSTSVVRMDLLQSLLDELEKLGEHYFVVALVPGLDAEASIPGFDAHLTIRDAVIARRRAGILLIQVQVENFQTNLTFSTPIGPIVDKRGWAAIDIMVRGRAFRFVTTHLDADSSAIQQAQVHQLISDAGNTGLPTVFAGDFNANASNPLDPTFAIYQTLLDNGFIDGWKRDHQSAPGFTCCQDANLQNSNSKLDQRIDLILLRGNLDIEDVDLVGNLPADRTPSGLWPSDHAGLVANITSRRGRERAERD
jgi:endonuclease/exonuclease/phosphatase family metal-dependent hydrolase